MPLGWGSRPRAEGSERCREGVPHKRTGTNSDASVQEKAFIFCTAFPCVFPSKIFVNCYPVVSAVLGGVGGGELRGRRVDGEPQS